MYNGNDLSATRVRRSNRKQSSLVKRSPRARKSTAKSEASAGVTSQWGAVEEGKETVPSVRSGHVAEQGESTTGAVGSALASYFREVGSVPLLTPQEEIELAARIKKGDLAARERMIRANLRLVVKIAREYENLGLPLLDLISEGTIGLMKAVDKFDPAKGGKLSTYGSWWIKQQVRRALANQGRTIRLPVHVEGKLYRLSRAEAKLRDLLGREATDEELADELETTPRRIGRLRDAAIRPSSLDAPVGDDNDATIGDLVGDERVASPLEQLRANLDHQLVRELLSRLPAREMEILRSRFGLDGADEETLEEIGARFKLTRERIRQLQNEAFDKLRALLENPRDVGLEA